MLAGSALLPSFAKSAHRKGKLLYHTEISNAEPVLQIVGNWMTPTDAFYIRSHAPIPKSITILRLKVEGLVEKTAILNAQTT